MAEREVFWNISYHGVFYLLAFFAVVIFFAGCYRNIWVWLQGWPSANKLDFSRIFSATLKQILGNVKVFSGDLFGGLTHLFIMWGFFVLLLGTGLSAFNDYIFHFLYGPIYLYYSLVLDVFGVLFIAGLIMGLIRRYIIKAGKMNNLLEDPLVLFLLLAIGDWYYRLFDRRIPIGS